MFGRVYVIMHAYSVQFSTIVMMVWLFLTHTTECSGHLASLAGRYTVLGRFPTQLWIHGACLDFWKKDIGLRSQPMLPATQKC